MTAADPFDSDDSGSGSFAAGRMPGDLLTVLWALLARPSGGTASTVSGRLCHTADELIAVLRRSHPAHLALARSLAELLHFGSAHPARFGTSPRTACVEAVERLILGVEAQDAPVELPVPEQVAVVVSPRGGERRLMHAALRELGLTVHGAASRFAALGLLAETPCDLVVTDCELGDGTGFELSAALRMLPHLGNTPVLMLTPNEAVPYALRRSGIGGVRIAVRPLARAEFVLRVRTLLA